MNIKPLFLLSTNFTVVIPIEFGRLGLREAKKPGFHPNGFYRKVDGFLLYLNNTQYPKIHTFQLPIKPPHKFHLQQQYFTLLFLVLMMRHLFSYIVPYSANRINNKFMHNQLLYSNNLMNYNLTIDLAS